MPDQKTHLNADRANRAAHLRAAMATLEKQIKKISKQGEVAPAGCCLARYQVRKPNRAYWYYKLQATEPIFEQATVKGSKSKYKHLGKAGSPAHIEAVLMVSRRVQIDSLQRTIESLKESWLDVCTGAEIEQTPAKSPQSD